MAGNKRWTQKDINFLKENYGITDIAQIVKKLDRSIDSIHYKASQLEIPFKKVNKSDFNEAILSRLIEVEKKLDMILSIYQKKVNVQWSTEDVEFLKENYNRMTTAELAKSLDVTVTRVQSKVWDLGLGKKKRPSTKAAEKYIKENLDNLDMSYVLDKFNISKHAYYNLARQARQGK